MAAEKAVRTGVDLGERARLFEICRAITAKNHSHAVAINASVAEHYAGAEPGRYPHALTDLASSLIAEAEMVVRWAAGEAPDESVAVFTAEDLTPIAEALGLLANDLFWSKRALKAERSASGPGEGGSP